MDVKGKTNRNRSLAKIHAFLMNRQTNVQVVFILEEKEMKNDLVLDLLHVKEYWFISEVRGKSKHDLKKSTLFYICCINMISSILSKTWRCSFQLQCVPS